LLLAGHLSDWYGRRHLLLPALAIAIVSAIVFLASKSLTGLLVARLINGISIGIVPSTATAFLAELHARGRPQTTARKAQLTASAVNLGGLGVGALAAGVLAQWVAHPLTVPYLVFVAALLLAAIGLFTGLAGRFLSLTLHQPSHALAGAVVCVMFAAGVAAQILTATWPVSREFEAGMAAMITGLTLAVLAVWLRPPSLGLFIAGGALIGAGGGAIFKGAIGTVMSIAPPDRIAESLTGIFLSSYVGLSLPVVGAGITLARDVSPKVTLLGFAIAVSVGIAASAIKLVGRTTAPAPATPITVGGVAEARSGEQS
jgi:Sugar (and other) transporter